MWLPVRLVLTSSTLLLIGGGDRMFASLILTMIADVTQYSQRSRPNVSYDAFHPDPFIGPDSSTSWVLYIR